MTTHLWLRAETKPAEHRTALTPSDSKKLIDVGFKLTVEESSQSAFSREDYQNAGCEIVREHSWKTEAPLDAIILGLKELETEKTLLTHRHIHFAHVYKNQAGWEKVINRFSEGGGVLYDLEFLVDDKGKRIATFGCWAGFSGAALAVLAWANNERNCSPVLDPVKPRAGKQELIDEVQDAIDSTARKPSVFVIGALGRCGKGAVELCRSVGVDVVEWDLEETRKGGPFEELLAADVFLNCVFVEKAIPPFLTRQLLDQDSRQLSVVCDVSCDPYGDYNPLPIYEKCTTFDDPVTAICHGANPVQLIAIDHLPSMLPRESSEDFSEQLLPWLMKLEDLDHGVWKRAYELFQEKAILVETAQVTEDL